MFEALKTAQLKATFARQNVIFYLVMTICVVIGICLILYSINQKHSLSVSNEELLLYRLGQAMPPQSVWPTKPVTDQVVRDLIVQSGENTSLFPDLLRDLGIALLVSVFVTFSIERYASRRLQQHITYDVLSAAYAKVVPEKIYTQVADNVFRSDVYRRNWEVHIVSNKDQLDAANGIAIVTSRYSYDLENLNEKAISYSVPASIDLDVPYAKHPDIPRFKSFEIIDEHNYPLIDQAETKDLFATPVTLNEGMKRKANVTMTRDIRHLALSAEIKIGARKVVRVRYEVERAIRVPGNYVLSCHSTRRRDKNRDHS